MPHDYLLSLLLIIGIDLILGGDNAVVIAMASRNLAHKQRQQAIIFGTFIAVVLRIVLTSAAVYLLNVPFLQCAFITGLLVIMLYVVFLLIDYHNIAARWRDYLPPSMRDDVSGFVEEFIQATNRYFRSQALVACCVAVLFAIGFSIIGLPLAILMGIFIGLLNMVPYLQIVGTIPCLLLAGLKALEQGDNFLGALGLVLLVFGVVQLIQETVLVSRFQGEAMGLSPAIILLSISVWGKLLGFLGLILALPLTCLGLIYYRRYLWKLEPAGEPSEIKE